MQERKRVNDEIVTNRKEMENNNNYDWQIAEFERELSIWQKKKEEKYLEKFKNEQKEWN